MKSAGAWWYHGEMEDQELQDRLAALEKKLDAVYRSAEQTRQYFLWLIAGSVLVFLLPLVGLVFAIPAFLSAFNSLSSF